MSLELLVGPMFAGKSSHLLSIIRRYTSINYPILILTSHLDTRYEKDAIHSHNHESFPAMAVTELLCVLPKKEYKDSKLIVIEESQFFQDLVTFVLRAVEQDGKHVIVVGLDGDSERRPFGQILRLVPFCDKLTKITSFCSKCGDGTPALFTHRKTNEQSVISVGTATKYEPLCRKHYLEEKRDFLKPTMKNVVSCEDLYDLTLGC
jgi:thymidine kinase